jgi:hypothetical protein
MLKQTRIFLLLVVTFLYALPVYAEIIGGHERQRLTLMLVEMLRQYYQVQPLQLYLPELPVQVAVDDPDQSTLYVILKTLAEEHLIVEHKKDLETLTQSGGKLFSVIMEYSAPKNNSVIDVRYGDLVVDEAISVQSIAHSHDGYTRVKIEFTWHLVSPAEWLWAPRLNSIDEIRYLKESTASKKTGHAVFVWQDDSGRWMLQSPPNIQIKIP